MRSKPNRRKLDRIHTPLGIDQLEARMLCAVDTISELLNSLNDASVPTVDAAQVSSNKVPAFARPISQANPKQAIVRSVNLSALGRDDRPEASLTYRWSVTSTTQGASGTFSVNGSNAAKNTTLHFTRAGNYTVQLSIVDESGLTVTSSLRVTVSQILSSIEVRPGTSTVAPGKTQQLTARGLDQFQQPLSRQPAFTWSTTAGRISKSGLFTAPNTSVNATVTARSGNVSATARLTVAVPTPAPTPAPTPTPTPTPTPSPTPNTGLSNAALSNLVSTYFADGSINRSEMIQLLRSAGTDGLVDGSELNDFRYIVSNASRYNIPNYVSVLASNVVNTNPANSLFRGQTAGNLAAGASSALLNNLVEKWFLGVDLPTLTSTSFSYQVTSGNLFNGTPSGANMKQGQLGDCYFIASLGSIADRNPTAVSNMFIDNGDNTFTVRFYASAGMADYVTVNRQLPAFSNGVLAYSGMGSQVNNASNTLWIALAEKAYAQWNATGKSGRDGTNSYASIEGGWMGAVNAQVLGYSSTNHSLDNPGQTTLIGALNTNQAVTIGTRPGASAGGLVGGHAYTVTGYNPSTQTFTLVNPWGTSHPAPLTWAQLQANCSMFVVANPSTTTPFFATPSVRSVADPTSLSFVVNVSSNTSHAIDSDALNSVIELAGNEQESSSSSNAGADSLELIELVLEELAKEESNESLSFESTDLALDALMDAILNLDQGNRVLA